MRNKLIYSCSIKIPASEFSELLESIFCLLLVVEAVSLQKVIEILEEVVVSWREVRWIWWMRQNLIAHFIQLWSVGCVMCSQHCSGEELDPFCLPVLAVSLRVLVLLIILLSIHLRCSGFVGIQKLVVSQTGSRPPNKWPWSHFGASLTLESPLELLSLPTELVIASCIKSTFRRTLQSEKWFVVT